MVAKLVSAPTRSRALQVWFCAWYVAGVRTQYENVRSVATRASDVTLRYLEVSPYKADGWIERLPLLGSRAKGSMRSFVCTLPLFATRQVDAIWTQADIALFPFLATRAHFSRIPYLLSTDATTTQVEAMSDYGLLPASSGIKHHLRARISAYVYQHAAYVLPWSQWAARAIEEEFGVASERMRVIPPGVNLTEWPMAHRSHEASSSRPMRLLFVGGDFDRKGGPKLLEVFRARFRGRCELHLVTRSAPEGLPEAGVFVYADLGPNDPELHRLYQTCDALVLPTRADCFSLASIEAMASGLPVITCPIGGIPEIVEDGTSGFLVAPGDGAALASAIETLMSAPGRARAMGLRGRRIAEERFDAAKNADQALDLLRAQCAR
jgi:glycosyltransferase involved in cell wall biosynthesis